jgi:hypothetical protein
MDILVPGDAVSTKARDSARRDNPRGTGLKSATLAANATTFAMLLPVSPIVIELSIAKRVLPIQSHDSSFSSYHPAGPYRSGHRITVTVHPRVLSHLE